MKKLISLYFLYMACLAQAQWTQIGSTVLEAGAPPSYASDSDPLFQKIAFHPVTGAMYVMTRDYTTGAGSGRPTVRQFDGANWVTIGSAQFTPGDAEGFDIAIHPNTGNPYVSFYDASAGGISVMRYNSTSMMWEYFGTAGFAATPNVFDYDNDQKLASATRILIDPGTQQPIVLFQKSGAGDGASAMTYTGISTGWVNVGSEFVMGADLSSGTSDFVRDPISGDLYVFAPDKNQSGGSSIFRFNGVSWSYHGNAGFTIPYGGTATNRRIGFFVDMSTAHPTIAFKAGSNSYKFILNANTLQWEESPLALPFANYEFPFMEFADDPLNGFGSPYSVAKNDLAANGGFRINYRVQRAGQFLNIGHDLDFTFPANGTSGQSSGGHLDRSDIEYRPTDGLPYFLVTSFSDDANKNIQLLVYSFENSAPTDITLTNNSITEGVPANTTIGNFFPVDLDSYDSHAYSLVSGIGDADNSSFTLFNNNILRSQEVFDYDIKNTYSIRIRCEDHHGLAYEKAFTINVVEGNVLPTDIVLDNNSILEGSGTSRLVGSLTAVDANAGDTHTFVETAGEGDEGNSTFSLTGGNMVVNTAPLDASVQDEYTMRIRVYDGAVINDPAFYSEHIITIYVTEFNDAPVVDQGIPNPIIDEDAQFIFQIPNDAFSDDENDPLTFSAGVYTGSMTPPDPLPSWLNFNSSTGVFFGLPTNDDVGSVNITVTADDNIAGTATDIFFITVQNVNDAPTANVALIPNATQGVFYSNFSFNTIASDVDDPSHLLTFELFDDQLNPVTYPPSASAITGHVPQQENVGDHNLILRVSDDDGAFTDNPFTFTVHNVNDAPTVANPIPDQSVAEEANFSFQFAENTFEDIDGDLLQYSATLTTGSPIPGWLAFDAVTRTFSAIPDDAQIGMVNIRVTATDQIVSVFDDFSIEVTSVNDAPEAVQDPLEVTYQTGQAMNFWINTNFTDVDHANHLITYELLDDQLNPATWPSISINGFITGGVLNSGQIGVYNLVLRASDPLAASVDADLIITVTAPNNPPGLVNPLGTQQITEDIAFNFQFAADVFNDVDGDPITYSATLPDGSPLPGWLNFDANTRTFTGTPTNDEVGLNPIRITATDDKNASNFTDFNFDVINSNDAPIVINTFVLGPGFEDQAYNNFISHSNYFSDPDQGDVLTYSVTLADDTPLDGNWLSHDPISGGLSGTPTQMDVGTNSYKVIATDQSNESVSIAFDIIIQNTNDPVEVINPIPNQFAAAGELWIFQIAANTFFDEDPGNPMPFLVASETGQSTLPSWLQFVPINGTFQTIGVVPLAEAGNIYSIDVKASDGQSPQVTTTFQLTIVSNSFPTVSNPIPDQQIDEDVSWNYQFPSNTFSDTDGDPLNYTSTLSDDSPLPIWLLFDESTQTFSGTPLNADVGTIIIKVIADDGKGGSALDEFNLTITNTNDAPVVANGIPSQTATEDQVFSFQFANNTFEDEDVGDVLTYTAEEAGTSTLPAWLSFDPNTRTFSGTPTNADVGIITILLTADDGNGGTASLMFDLEVQNVNDAPVVANAIPDQSTPEDALYNYQIPGNTFSDEDGDSFIYSASKAPVGLSDDSNLPAWLSFDASTVSLSGTPSFENIGTITVRISADDQNGGSVTDEFALEVTGINDAPIVANVIPAQSATEDVAYNFQFSEATFSDEENDVLTYTATLSNDGSLPSWLSFSGSNRMFTGTPVNDDVGSLVVKVIADDGNGGTASTEFSLEVVNTNDAPSAVNTIPNQMTDEDAPYSYQFPENTFRDDDGDGLVYTAALADDSSLPAWLSFDGNNRTFEGTPTSADLGSIGIKVTADDGNGGMGNVEFTLEVINTNDGPIVVNAIENQTTDEDALYMFVVPQNTFSDEDGDALTYTAALVDDSALPAWLIFESTTQTFTGTPTNEFVGAIEIKVSVDDGNGGTVATNFELEVVNTNDAPHVANEIPDQMAVVEEPFSFQIASGTFTDEDAGDVLTFTANLADASELPDWLLFDGSTQTFSGIPKEDHVGEFMIVVTAHDGNDANVSDQFALEVTEVTGLPEELSAVAIYPNPASDLLTLSIEKNARLYKVTIRTVGGQKIYESKEFKAEGTHTVPINELKQGSYLLSISSEGATATFRFIKK